MPIYNKEEFVEECKKRVPEELKDSKEFWKACTYLIKKRDRFYQYDIPGAIELMERLRLSNLKDKKSELTDEDIITSDYLIDKIAPWVEDVRKKIFGSPEPAFDWDGAVKWIENRNKDARKSTRAMKGLRNKFKELAKELGKNYQELRRSRRVIPYAKKGDEWMHNVPINSLDLYILEQETRRIAKVTGFPQQSLVVHVLSGNKPIVPRVGIHTLEHFCKLSDQETLYGVEIILEIRAKDFRFRELYKIYQTIRKELELVKNKPFKEKHLRFYRFIKDLGKIPDRGKKGHYKFWNEAKEEWNKKFPNNKYKSWQGLRAAYERIIDALEKNISVTAKSSRSINS